MKLELARLLSHPRYHEIMSVGQIVDGGFFVEVEMQDDGTLPVRLQPNRLALAISQRPRMVALIKHFRKPSDEGLGDTLARLAGGLTGERFADWFARLGGTSCGCADAKQWLNQSFPYDSKPLQIS